MRQRTGTLTITIPPYADSARSEVSGAVSSVANDINFGQIDLDRGDEAIIRVRGAVAGAWEVTIFNPEGQL